MPRPLAAIIAAAIVAAMCWAHDPRDLLASDYEYCQRVAAGVHTDYLKTDCAAVVAAWENLSEKE